MRRALLLISFLAVFLAAFMTAPAVAVTLSDIQESPYVASITKLADQGIICGYPDGTFRPDLPLQRQQFAKLLVLTLGIPVNEEDTCPFSDTPAPYSVDDPLYPGCYVGAAARLGLILGKPDGTFDFAGYLTRQQAISMVVRAAAGSLAEPPDEYQDPLGYRDPAHDLNIKRAEYNGLLSGIPIQQNWSLTEYTTRGEAAELLAQLLLLGQTRSVAPIVSTDWLEANLDAENLVVLDIRSPDAYAAGHIPGAVNASGGFYINITPEHMIPGGEYMELPPREDLFVLLGSLGLTPESKVVVVGGLGAPEAGIPQTYGLADATRVADTLIYAGIPNVAILDGAYPKWQAEGRPVSTDEPVIAATSYHAPVRAGMWVSTAYVASKIGQAIIVDARDAEVYSGEVMEPWADKPGHIPTAVSLPAPLIWDSTTWTYKSSSDLQALATAAVGSDENAEIIVYCGVGGYESSWWYVLTQVLGYNNVKLYDGAAQAWVASYDMVTSSPAP